MKVTASLTFLLVIIAAYATAYPQYAPQYSQYAAPPPPPSNLPVQRTAQGFPSPPSPAGFAPAPAAAAYPPQAPAAFAPPLQQTAVPRPVPGYYPQQAQPQAQYFPRQQQMMPQMPGASLLQTEEEEGPAPAAGGEAASETVVDTDGEGASSETKEVDNPPDAFDAKLKSEHPEDPLASALAAVKDEIGQKVRQIKREREWVDKAQALIAKYSHKTDLVRDNIVTVRNKLIELLKKKKQIQNLQLQEKLQKKVELANNDLDTVDAALEAVHKKESEFGRHKKVIASSISALQKQLTNLKGSEGEAAAGSAEGESAGAEGAAEASTDGPVEADA